MLARYSDLRIASACTRLLDRAQTRPCSMVLASPRVLRAAPETFSSAGRFASRCEAALGQRICCCSRPPKPPRSERELTVSKLPERVPHAVAGHPDASSFWLRRHAIADLTLRRDDYVGNTATTSSSITHEARRSKAKREQTRSRARDVHRGSATRRPRRPRAEASDAESVPIEVPLNG